MDYYLRSQRIYDRLKSEEVSYADMLERMANLYDQRGEIERAVLYYRKSLTINKKTRGAESDECKRVELNLATLLDLQGKNEESI